MEPKTVILGREHPEAISWYLLLYEFPPIAISSWEEGTKTHLLNSFLLHSLRKFILISIPEPNEDTGLCLQKPVQLKLSWQFVLLSLEGFGRASGEWDFSILVPASGLGLANRILLPPLRPQMSSHFSVSFVVDFFFLWLCFYLSLVVYFFSCVAHKVFTHWHEGMDYLLSPGVWALQPRLLVAIRSAEWYQPAYCRLPSPSAASYFSLKPCGKGEMIHSQPQSLFFSLLFCFCSCAGFSISWSSFTWKLKCNCILLSKMDNFCANHVFKE